MPEQTIVCPNCGKRIQVSEALTHQIEADLRKSFESEIKERDKETQADFEKRFENKKYWIYAAKYEGKEVSFAAWYESKPREIYYWLTATSDEHKKRGLAVKLFDFALKISKELGYKKGICPKAEEWYKSEISIPIYPSLKRSEQETVILMLKKILSASVN